MPGRLVVLLVWPSQAEKRTQETLTFWGVLGLQGKADCTMTKSGQAESALSHSFYFCWACPGLALDGATAD